MIAQLTKGYAGVTCLRCGEPIPVSAQVIRLQEEIELKETNVPHTFVARCKLGEYEDVYLSSAVKTFDGEPRKRIRQRARAARA